MGSPFNPIIANPVDATKTSNLAVSWKFDKKTGTEICNDGKSSTMVLAPGVAGIAGGGFPPFVFPLGVSGKFSLAPPGVLVNGLFRNADGLGDSTVATGLTTEDVTGLLSRCQTPGNVGLKGITFGLASAAFSPSGAFLE